MTEYIERQEAIAAIMSEPSDAHYPHWYADKIKSIPAADVAPVRHGRWECIYDDSTGETDITCSYCKNTRTIKGCFVSIDGKSCYFEDDYCPNCGARMDGDNNGER